ncbi:MAG: DNA-directed RNA polymerase subunit omega [Clostridium sp.]|nr:DNA-directed RNA polymerase subunit omega [Clostridium sp.]
MLRPSFNDLIDSANKYSGHPEKPTVQSRYSIVIASAKRARQIVAQSDPAVDDDGRKPLSVAIDEIYKGRVQILSDEDDPEDND